MINIAIVEDEAMYAKQLQEFLQQYQKENGETGQCDVYDDQNECPNPRTYVNVDGRDGYIKLGEFNDSQASPLRCYIASAGREFAILKRAYR